VDSFLGIGRLLAWSGRQTSSKEPKMQRRKASFSKLVPASWVILLGRLGVGSGCGIHAVGVASDGIFQTAASSEPLASTEIAISRENARSSSPIQDPSM